MAKGSHPADSPSNEGVIRSAGNIARQRLLHAATRLFARALSGDRAAELEFEYRYQRYVAKFGEADSDIFVSTFSKSR